MSWIACCLRPDCTEDTTVAPVPSFGDYWIAEISFFPENPKHNYIIRIRGVHGDRFWFLPFFDDELKVYESDRVNCIRLIKKVMNWDGSFTADRTR